MKSFRIVIICTLFLLPWTVSAQEIPLRDTTIIFKPANPELVQKQNYQFLRDALGIDLLISNNGFGAGAFFRREFDDELAGTISLIASEVKDDREIEYYDYWGQSYTPGKKNRMIMFPLMAGAQYRLFKDDIVDNFRPFITGGMGPAMVFVSPYSRSEVVQTPYGPAPQTEQIEFFSSLKYGKAHWTMGLFVGAGAHFGIDKGTLSGISFRYYWIPLNKGIESMEGIQIKNLGGFYITLNFGSFY
ncbi:MAG: hypothetical protein V1799_04840 [bacterium]